MFLFLDKENEAQGDVKCLAQGHMGSSLSSDSQADLSPALHDQAVGQPFLSMSTYSVPSPCAEALGVQGGMGVPAPGFTLPLGSLIRA